MRAIRGDGISVNGTLPPSYLCVRLDRDLVLEGQSPATHRQRARNFDPKDVSLGAASPPLKLASTPPMCIRPRRAEAASAPASSCFLSLLILTTIVSTTYYIYIYIYIYIYMYIFVIIVVISIVIITTNYDY